MKNIYRLKNLYSSDLACNKVSEYRPSDPEDVYFQMYVDLECTETRKSTEFQLVVATPKGLVRDSNTHDSNLLSDRAIMVYRQFQYEELVVDLGDILSKCAHRSGSFEDVVFKMQRYFAWEYEDAE